ncbi:calcium-binding protein, putative [Plasmodium chabaudi chabaudi]|uniref:Calcium-binding protein, putative n=2 Tax=Plasmodium chabaudi TaxID=5825 RepID=A0A077TG40_PLACU|nr:calcium-binding protein, putative [Plasmodium chabaudi chabaudi]SCM19005.1 calcium-binding protein, putative [Plasmodium chabaudi adami]SCM19059.1 calcium-binding protein, putative [Plasmodium chabaudi chabaudi]SCN58625.1 calcium-binding protein, putative [Plasmodium chabaudi chabaudi]SCN58649.1 calcium-binding protein, putative [Plasmodium chabaudi adami]VTZ66228.1 calcium-binding protein, putative [Plasmodium chabaudi chabaudi]|eukprot:XP_744509.1 calcium-binding protein, putative [Plasmodium chabaudi chabaudi]
MDENIDDKKRESNYKYLNSDEMNNLEYIFNKIKKNKNENVPIQNIEKFLLKNHNEQICDDLLSYFHIYGSTVTLDDFINHLNCDINEFKSKEKIKSLFEMLDENKKGFITSKDFINAAKEFDNEFKEDVLKNIFKIIDLNNNNKIIFDEFKNAIWNI